MISVCVGSKKKKCKTHSLFLIVHFLNGELNMYTIFIRNAKADNLYTHA
jgi:hypothetical protein